MALKLSTLLGIEGVAASENEVARDWGMFFRVLIILITMGLLYQHYLLMKHIVDMKEVINSLWFVCAFFIIETLVLAYLVDNKKRYLLHNWMNFVIIVISFPPFLYDSATFGSIHLLRVLLIVRLLPPFYDAVVSILLRNKITTTIIVMIILTVFWGEVFPLIDPSIATPLDGIWFAWETVSTTGYGDVVPHNLKGRLFAIFLMIVGVALTSLLTANFASFILSRSTKGAEKADRKILDKLANLEKQLEELKHKLDASKSGR